MVIHYITEKEAYEKYFERGDELRIKDVLYECRECGARTNKVMLGGLAGFGLRWICPSDEFKSENPDKKVSVNIEDIEGLDTNHIIKKFTPSAKPMFGILKEEILEKYSLR